MGGNIDISVGEAACGGTNECMAGSDVAPLLGYCPATWIGDGAGCPKNGDGHAPYRAFGA